MPAHPYRFDAADAAFARYRASASSADLAAVFDATALGLSVLAGHLARRSGDAEDLVQQTFLVAMRDARTWDGERPVAAWLAGILRHRALELNRRRERARHDNDAPLDELHAREPSPLDLAADAETAERIAAAIERIDGPSQQVLALRLVHGLEPTAIAHALGRPPGTVRMQLARGLERLRELLPASLAAVVASLALEARGLAAVRASILAAAPATAPVAAVLTTSAAQSLVSALVMKKWIVVVGILLVALVATLRFAPRDGLVIEGATGGPDTSSTSAELARAEPSDLAVNSTESARVEVREGASANATTSAASLTVRVVALDDGSVCADIGVVVSRVGGGAALRVVTDAAGEARFTSGIEDGDYIVGVDRQSDSRAVNVDGATAFTFEIEGGVDVVGRVVDFNGAPVADASVCFVDTRRREVLVEFARTDAAGRFSAAMVQPNERLVARAKGHQMSPPRELGDGGAKEIVLTLGARGHTVRGRVRDASGAAVPFARVVVGSEQRARREWSGASTPLDVPSSESGMLLEGTLTMADADGRFELDEVPAGEVLVIARPHGRSDENVGWSRGFLAFAGELEVDVTLARGARIVGTVKDAAGRPIVGHRVLTNLRRSAELGTFFGDQLLGPVLDNASVTTDAHGAFVVVGLLPGIHAVGVGPKSVPGDALERTELRVRVGETVRFGTEAGQRVDQVIALRGPHSEPLASWLIEFEGVDPIGPGWVPVFHTNAEGRARLPGLESDMPFAIGILPPNGGAIARRCEFVASTSEIVIELGAHELPSAAVVARLADPLPGLELALVATNEAGHLVPASVVPDATGAVRFDDVVPGEYRIETRGAGHPHGEVLARFVVAPNTVHDAGTLVLPERGRVVVELECDDGRPVSIAHVVMRTSEGHEIDGFEDTDAGLASPPLIPGSYRLSVVPVDAAPFEVNIEVDMRPLQHHRLRCARGARVRVEVAPFKNGTTTPQSVEVMVGVPDVEQVFSRTFTRAEGSATFEFDFHLAPGAYHVWAHEPDGPQREPFDGPLVVTDEGGELRIVLD